MALLLANNADGGSNGVSVSPGNSGGASGDAFDGVTPGASQTIAYDTAVSMSGASIKFTLAAAQGYVSWTTSLGTLSAGVRFGGRVYVTFSAAPNAAWQFFRVMTGTTLLATVRTNASAQLQVGNTSGAAIVTGTTSLSAGTWYRFEWDLAAVGTASSSFTASVYLGDSTTVLDSVSGTAADFGSTAPDTIRLGQSASSFVSGTTLNFDDFVVNDTGMPGPARWSSLVAPSYFPHRLPLGV